MSSSDVQRKLTAILCADVVGYSRLMGDDEEATIETLTAYRKVFLSHIETHRGRVVDAKGDAILAEFASVVDAVKSAVEIQRELAEKNTDLSDDRRMDFRIGINLGDVVVKDDAIYGDGVNVAARLEALAEPGGICISRNVHDQVKAKLNLEYEYLGEQQVKNIAEPVRAYKVVLEQVEVDTAKPGSESATEPVHGALPFSEEEILPPTDKPSIAVLAFENMSGDPEQAYFSDGISEDIITDLSKISGLFVIARTASFSYKDRAINPQQVGQELGVRHVLEGSVRKSGNRVRITAQLIEAETDHHVWAERYDRDLDDVFAVQDEITSEIVTALDVRLVHGERARILRRSLKNPEARDCFYRAMEYRREADPAGNLEPMRPLLDRVIALEPDSPIGYISMAILYINEARRAWGQNRQATTDRAVELIDKALALDENDPWAHAALSFVHLNNMEHDRAIAEAERAIALSPSDPEILLFVAMTWVYTGDPEYAIVLIKEAIRLNPNYPIRYMRIVAAAYRTIGQYETTLKIALEIDRRNPGDVIGLFIKLTALGALGRHEEARTVVQVIHDINPRFSPTAWAKNVLCYKDRSYVERILDNLRKAGLPE